MTRTTSTKKRAANGNAAKTEKKSAPPTPERIASAAASPAKAETKLVAVAPENAPAEDQTALIAELGAQLLDENSTVALRAARKLEELVQQKPEVGLVILEKLAAGVVSANPRVVQAAATLLPIAARVAPARVARHLEPLTEAFPRASAVGKDGLVKTFAALCSASVAYQKRLEPILDSALSEADAKTTAQWTEIVLPALKGEPHARARSVIERRLSEFPRPIAQKVADFLGIKLRRPVP